MDASVHVTPDAALFTRGPSGVARVPFTVRNTGADSVGVFQCGPQINPMIERLQGVQWTTDAGGVCLAIHYMGPIPLAPGTQRADTTAIAEPGRYRLVVAVDGGQLRSPAFDVR